MSKNNKQVAVIGSANLEDTQLKKTCIRLGETLADNGYSLVCGGLGGVMEFTCKGFKASVCSIGVTIGILPSYEHADANPFIDVVIPTGLDIGRNQLVVASGFAVIVFGGGAGTLSELALASQMNKPIILFKGSGGWADKLSEEYLDQRKNSKIYHAHSIDDINILLEKLACEAGKTGVINSGHNR